MNLQEFFGICLCKFTMVFWHLGMKINNVILTCAIILCCEKKIKLIHLACNLIKLFKMIYPLSEFNLAIYGYFAMLNFILFYFIIRTMTKIVAYAVNIYDDFYMIWDSC